MQAVKQPLHGLPGLAPEALPILGLGVTITGATALFSRKLALAPLALTVSAGLFFRDPKRPLPTNQDKLYSAADGLITYVDEIDEPRFIKGRALRIATFLSLFDAHINRTPASGRVRYREYRPGQFRVAWDAEADAVNERNYIGLETPHGPLLVVQIAGLVARRIVCRVEPDEQLVAGQRIGMIKFGSRTDVLVPVGVARPLVVAGMHVYAGTTAIGAWT
jgi:phosphatidylserine decarboxylase